MLPLEGRRLWFVGIGGAGLSAYAQLARAWGAEVGGWDRVATPYLAPLAGLEIEISPEPSLPGGWEAVVSSAYPAVPGLPRAGFLAELVRLRRSIVVGGTHGKGTTAAMIAFALRETGGDPAWLIGAPVPQLGSNAGAGEGWLVVEGDESDRTVFGLPAEIAVVTNVDLDHHSRVPLARRARGGVRPLGRGGPARGPGRARLRRGRSPCPASTTAATRAPRSPRSSSPGSSRAAAVAALGRFTGTGRRFEVSRGGGGDDRRRLRPSPRGDRGDDRRRARGVSRPAAPGALPAAPRLADAPPRR